MLTYFNRHLLMFIKQWCDCESDSNEIIWIHFVNSYEFNMISYESVHVTAALDLILIKSWNFCLFLIGTDAFKQFINYAIKFIN
jgi:hypothetical protein